MRVQLLAVAVRTGTTGLTPKDTAVAKVTIRIAATGRATLSITDTLTLATAGAEVEELSMAASGGLTGAATESSTGRALTCPVYTYCASSADIAACATVVAIGVRVRAITVAPC
jgi:hypothetical protein